MASVHVHILDAPDHGTAGNLRNDPNPKPYYRYASTLSAALAWVYALSIPIIGELYAARRPHDLDLLAPWIAVPLQILALVSVGWMLADRSLAARGIRRFWWLILAYTALNTVANYVWNVPRASPDREELDLSDALYLVDYCILTAAFAFMFARAGGTFRRLRVWLDATTMVAVQLVALWSVFLAPALPREMGRGITMAATLSYSFVLSVMMTMAALLCMQVQSSRGRAGVLLLVAAAAATAAWEIIWLGSWLVDFEFIGPYYNYGDVLCFACIITAACFSQHRGLFPAGAANPERRLDGFLPALAALMGIAMVAGTLATTKRMETWIIVGLVSLCTLLLITRQRNVRAELDALDRQLAARESDARLTELVRRSNDLIVVVDRAGMVSFASPVARSMLCTPASRIKGTPAVHLFGSSHESSMRRFLDCVASGGDAPEAMEIRLERPYGDKRVLTLAAADQLANPLINGIVVTAHDVTGQRLLEREVLDAATRERVRLSGDIHDGLGQELTGIALLLHATAKAPDPDPVRQRRQLEAIVERVNQSIGTARDLARGLSPLHVAHGSLSRALTRLVQASNPRMPIDLSVDKDFQDEFVDAFSADHLYRIVHEAVNNASRHSAGTRIEVHLGASRTHLMLSIADDGKGMAKDDSREDALGLRLMEYRARVLGGTLLVSNSGQSGTRVELAIPRSATRHVSLPCGATDVAPVAPHGRSLQ